MESLYGNITTSASRFSQRVGDARKSRRNLIGPSRTRLVNRHNPYATPASQQDTDGSTLKGRRDNWREGRSRPSAKRVSIHLNRSLQKFSKSSRQPSAINADVAVATPSGTWEGASQDVPHLRLPKSTLAPPLSPIPAPPETQPDYAPACASTTALPSPPTTPRAMAQDLPLDEFGLYSFLEYEDNYGSNFFDSFDLGCSASYPEQITPAQGVEEEIPQTTSHPPTPLLEPARRSAGKINLSSLHHRVMRSKGYIPDVSLDQLDGTVRKQILRRADRLMFEYQAQSREQRKWRGYREPEDDGLLKRPKKKVRFNPCPTEGRNKKRSVKSGVDELVHRVNRIQLSA
ncbi:hypothetical protein BDM02DRAFT_135456 [Thelephora ganbajun]|uniref:Uncharacterized protein n=1 Tax=Thelephora ganbajun TaxID=370292 RepID=A0ACB6ZZ09_THEGA|nr:hypothetical protein BDM02DRAFT_135456 [Thelephora ganbajun]